MGKHIELLEHTEKQTPCLKLNVSKTCKIDCTHKYVTEVTIEKHFSKIFSNSHTEKKYINPYILKFFNGFNLHQCAEFFSFFTTS